MELFLGIAMSIVKIENLKKSYYISDKGVPILWDLNLEIGEGEIVSVEGSSGVGKSTLLNILGAMDEFDSGLVEVCGVNLGTITNTEKEKFRANKISFIYYCLILLPWKML